MWSQTRSTLYAGVLACALHIVLLGITAAMIVALPRHATPQLRVTLLQRAVPLPVQEAPGVAQTPEPAPAPKPLPREVRQLKPPLPRPVAEKKPVRPILPRHVKPIAKPRLEPPPPVKEKSTQTALLVPPVAPVPLPVAEPASADEGPAVAPNVDDTSSEFANRGQGSGLTSPAGSSGGIGENGNGAGGAGGPSATPDYNINPKPPYPLIARRIGAQGEVLLRVFVRQDGSVASVELAQSSGFSLLDESATRTVRDSWRFIPARLDGAPVDSWVEVPIKFILADS